MFFRIFNWAIPLFISGLAINFISVKVIGFEKSLTTLLVCMAIPIIISIIYNHKYGSPNAKLTQEEEERIAMGIIDDAKKKSSDIISQANRDAESIRKNSQQASVDAKTIINNAKNSAENVVKNAKNDAESVINSAYKEATRIKQEIQEEFWKSPEGRSVMAEERMYEIRKKEREEVARLSKQLSDEELARNIEMMKRMQESGN